MEASGNAFATVRRLEAIGYETKDMPSDITTGMAPSDRVNDAIDAYNIAVAYARRGTRPEVWVPSLTYQDHRALWHADGNAVGDAACQRNRIWGLFNGHGIALRHVGAPKALRRLLGESAGLGEKARLLTDLAIDELEHDLETKETIRQQIGRIVALTPGMRTAMSVMGIGQIDVFALVAYIGDVRRGPTPKHLCSYFGFKPIHNESGKDPGRNHLSRRGNGAGKALMTESAQSAMRYGRQPMHKWARRLAKEQQARLGHASTMAFVLAMTQNLYAHLRTRQDKGAHPATQPSLNPLSQESIIPKNLAEPHTGGASHPRRAALPPRPPFSPPRRVSAPLPSFFLLLPSRPARPPLFSLFSFHCAAPPHLPPSESCRAVTGPPLSRHPRRFVVSSSPPAPFHSAPVPPRARNSPHVSVASTIRPCRMHRCMNGFTT